MKATLLEIYDYLNSEKTTFNLEFGASIFVKHLDIYKLQDQESQYREQHPIPMPAVLFNFANDYQESGDGTQDVTIALTLTVLQEDYANSSYNSENKEKSLRTIDFTQFLQNILLSKNFSFGKMKAKSWRMEQTGSNIVKNELEFEITIKDISNSRQGNYLQTEADGELIVNRELNVEPNPPPEQESKFDTKGW